MRGRDRFRFRRRDSLTEEEYQGNAGSMTEAKRARLYFSISLYEWYALSELEKQDYIRRLPPLKTRSGGAPMTDEMRISGEYHREMTTNANIVTDFHAKILRAKALERDLRRRRR